MTTELEELILKAVRAYVMSHDADSSQLKAIIDAGKLLARFQRLSNDVVKFHGGRP